MRIPLHKEYIRDCGYCKHMKVACGTPCCRKCGVPLPHPEDTKCVLAGPCKGCEICTGPDKDYESEWY